MGLSSIAACVAVAGRIVLMPLLVLALATSTDYFSSGKMFIGANDSYFAFSQRDPVMVGGCTNCSIGCRKTFAQVLKFHGEAMMGKQDWLNLYTAAFVWNENSISTDIIELADTMDSDPVAHCLSGPNDWGSHIMTIAGDPQYIVNAIDLMNVSVPPRQREQLELGLTNNEKCPTRWVLEMLIRMFKYKPSLESTEHMSISAATFSIFPEYTECRMEASGNNFVGSKLILSTNGVDLMSNVPSVVKLFPYDFASSLAAIPDILPAQNTIYDASSVVQPRLMAFYGGCRVTEVNTTGVYVEDACTILPHWESYKLMLQVPDDVPVCSTTDVCIHSSYNSNWESVASLDTSTKYDHWFIRVNTFRSRFADSVSSSVLPGIVVTQLLVMGMITLYQTMSHKRSVLLAQIWAYKCQNGHMQIIYLAQITYHLAANSDLYFLGMTTGTLSFESIANLTMSFFAFSYSFVNILKARSGEQQLDRHFRLAWEITQVFTTAAVGALLFKHQQTSISYIMEANGELLRKASERGAKYCNLSDSCIIFKTNLAVIMLVTALAVGIIPFIFSCALNYRALRHHLSNRIVHFGSQRSTGSLKARGSKVFTRVQVGVRSLPVADFLKTPEATLTSFEKYCLGASYSALFNDCDDFANIVENDRNSTSVEAVLLAGFLYYGENVYQAPSVMLLLTARVFPPFVLRSFNILLLRWHIDPQMSAVSHPSSCTWYSASGEKHRVARAVPLK